MLGTVQFGPPYGIGALGDWNNARIIEIRKRIADVAIANGKIAGTIGSPENIDDLINMGADVIGLNQYCKSLANEFHKRQGKG